MKKFTKLFLSCAAVAALTAAVATSAMAVDVTGTDGVTGTYDDSANELSLTTGITDATSTTTVLVIGPNVTDTTNIPEGSIVYINQVDGDVPAKMGLIGDSLADGKYSVFVANSANDYAKKTATFKLGLSDSETITIGDVDLNGSITTQDAGYILRKYAGATTVIGKAGKEYTAADGSVVAADTKVIVGDVDLNGSITTQDAGYVLRKYAGLTTVIGKAGTDIEVIPVE